MNTLTLLGILTLGIVILCAFLIIKLPKSYYLKYLVIPLVIAYGLVIGLNYDHVLGYPYQSYPQGRFAPIGMRIVSGTSQSDDKIEVWVLQHRTTRLYVIPYDEDTKVKLQMAIEAGNKGELSFLQFGNPLKPGKQKGEGGEVKTLSDAPPVETKVTLPPKQ